MTGKRKRGHKGLTLPGYNYLGPFNSEDNGEPTNKADRAADVHDKRYKLLSGKYGYWAPYTKWNEADEEFLRDIQNETDYGARIARNVFKAKRKFYELGIIGKAGDAKRRETTPGLRQKRSRDTIEPKAPDAKKARRSFPNLLASPHFSNMTGETKMRGEGGSGTNQGLTETPIDDVYEVHRGPPNYTFASLPFYFDRLCSPTRWNDQWTFRMTSPYDCSVTTSSTDSNAGAGTDTVMTTAADSGDGTAQKARWFDYYAGMYKYYHVVSCRWKIIFENMSTEPLWLYRYYSNETDLPNLGTNADMLFWQGVEAHYVNSVANAIASTGVLERNEMNQNFDNVETAGSAGTTSNYETSNHVTPYSGSNLITLSGEYRTGDFKNEIHQDALVENWTLCTANPALSERLSFRIRPQWDSQAPAGGDASSRNRFFSYRYRIQLEYLVEFKELKDGLKYPLQTQPLTVTIANAQGVA